MFIKIPFESEIPFKTNISEITKMSLEHDFNVNDEVVLGNFYISGEYRSHEVSVNTDSFNYTLPFSVDYRNDIIKDSLEFNIEDFSYSIINNNTLKVNIEYSLKGEVKEEELFERFDETELESELAFIDDFLEKDHEEDCEEVTLEEVEKKDNVEDEELKTFKEEKVVEKIEVQDKKIVDTKKETEDVRLSEAEEKTIMDTIKSSDDTFVTYHIHIVKESETLESVCALYNVQPSFISEYNKIDSITIGDKILIPKIDE